MNPGLYLCVCFARNSSTVIINISNIARTAKSTSQDGILEEGMRDFKRGTSLSDSVPSVVGVFFPVSSLQGRDGEIFYGILHSVTWWV